MKLTALKKKIESDIADLQTGRRERGEVDEIRNIHTWKDIFSSNNGYENYSKGELIDSLNFV